MLNRLKDKLLAACLDVGVQFRDIESDGKWHRTNVEDDPRGKGDGTIKIFSDGSGGLVNNWKSGQQRTVFADDQRASSVVRQTMTTVHKEIAERSPNEGDRQTQFEAATRAIFIWEKSAPADPGHPYLTKKGIEAHGMRQHQGCLVIPVRAGEVIQSLQFISPDGSKKFLTDGRVSGCHFEIGELIGAAVICVAEGFATAASISESTCYPVVGAFSSGNLESVAKTLRDKYPTVNLVICADDDVSKPGNPGKTMASKAAQSVGGMLAIPDFGPDRPIAATDFNDLDRLLGRDAVKKCILSAAAAAPMAVAGVAAIAVAAWPDPQPLCQKSKCEPYPVDALPSIVKAAVAEVAEFVKAPIPLVASAAVAALSLAIQAHADAKRAEKLVGPVGLFLLTIADSGERKSTCDGFFTKAIRDYEEAQAELAKPILKNYKASIEAWESKRAGVKEKIRQLAKETKPTLGQEMSLRELEHEKPEPPRTPRLTYADVTPEALAFSMAKQWPSGGVVSAEAGIVFGSHGMSKESMMRNLATLNQLWDGNSLTIDRRSTESFTVRGARLTVALQVQEPTLREFFSQSGTLARGTGFLARFLVAWPESTQGFRPFTEAPLNWPCLSVFNQRITTILNQPVPIGEDGSLTPPILPLSVDAKAAWVTFYNAIECKLANGCALYDVRDVASKSADNAVRLAALFQIFEGGGGAIGVEAFEAASRIAAWHLNEARRFFGELVLPAELKNAARFDHWLIQTCRSEQTQSISTKKAQQFGPSGMRDKASIDAAVRELEDLGRVRLLVDGLRRSIEVNPRLLAITEVVS